VCFKVNHLACSSSINCLYLVSFSYIDCLTCILSIDCVYMVFLSSVSGFGGYKFFVYVFYIYIYICTLSWLFFDNTLCNNMCFCFDLFFFLSMFFVFQLLFVFQSS